MAVIIGIDPGLSGALAALDYNTGNIVDLTDMPHADGRVTTALLAEWALLAVAAVGIEKVGSMPGQGVASTFKFGAAWGAVHGAFGAHRHRIIDVRPQAWKKEYGIKGGDKAAKDKARRLAAERWPADAGLFARAKDDGRAEAALIAEYTRQLIIQETAT